MNYACLFLGFITEADVSAGLLEDFRVLFLFLFLFSSCSLGWRNYEQSGVLQLSMNESQRFIYLIIVLTYTKQQYMGGGVLSCQYESSLISASLLFVSYRL